MALFGGGLLDSDVAVSRRAAWHGGVIHLELTRFVGHLILGESPVETLL